MITIDNILEVEKHINEVDAVIFDLDDTLYSEKEYVRSGYHKIAEHFQQPQLENEMWQSFLRGGRAIDEALEAHGMTGQKDLALRIYREQNPDIHFYPGVEQMLSRVRISGKKIGIITDGRPEGQNAKIDALGLRSLADEIIITDELGGVEYRKPNPAAFQLMQHAFSVPFEKMLYVGDNPQKDFTAPTMLGMKTIYFWNNDGLYGGKGL